jgi:hypothetical protein
MAAPVGERHQTRFLRLIDTKLIGVCSILVGRSSSLGHSVESA